MDKEIITAMLAIDVVALEKTIDDEVQRHLASGLGQLLDEDSKRNGLKCPMAAQKVLTRCKDKKGELHTANLPSLEGCVKQMQPEIVAAFVYGASRLP